MKYWTIVTACALALGLMSAPVGVYADDHGKAEAAAEEAATEEAATEEASDDSGGNGGGDACGGGDGEAKHEGSH